ncbi:MAG: HAD family phosphatase [Eubacteriales bacterium]|nr:HAD family phosphatase [Eubacteriales bacterium]
MKKSKRILALLGAVILLAVFCLPMITAFGSGENANGIFVASIFAVFFVAVMAYLIMLVYRVIDKRKTPDGPVKNIIFDVGNVLLKYDWESYLAGYHFEQEKYERIADAVFRSKTWVERDRGDLTEQEYVEQMVAADPEDEKEIREIMKNCKGTTSSLDYAATWTAYLKKQGYRLYVLSNYCDYMRNETIKDMTFLKNMDGVVFSCDVHMIKPEAEIYRYVLNTYGLDAKETVFIDDRKENCEGAEKEGIHAIVFTSFKQAAAELEQLGVK